jgi:hypothetical protein
MHYGSHYFSTNGKPTIVPHQVNAVIGNRDGLSSTDIAEVKHLYDYYWGCGPEGIPKR